MSDAEALRTKLEAVARRELNETPETKRKGLSQLREFISEDQSLCCPSDDAFLIKFLRARKYDVDRAFQTIKNYFRARKENPDLFDDLSLCSVPFDACCREHRLVTLSNRRDRYERIVYECNVGAWNTRICSLTEALRLHALFFEHVIFQDEGQIMGVTIVLNFEGLGLHHLLEFTPAVLMKIIYVLQFRFLDDFEELRGLVPDDIISKVYGGTQESYDYEKLAADMKPCEEYMRKIASWGYR